MHTTNNTYESLFLPDGARIAYEIFGLHHLSRSNCSSRLSVPIVLVGGVSNVRRDFDLFADELARTRPVLIYDHRGIGDSTFAPGLASSSSSSTVSHTLSIESMSRDLLALLKHLKWPHIHICGFSMGGVIVQQLLFLPYLPANPIPLPFRVTHVLLAATISAVIRHEGEDKGKYGLKFGRTAVTKKRLTDEEKKAIVRPTLGSSFDPGWLADPKNEKRFEELLGRMIVGRPMKTILMQGQAIGTFSFANLHSKLLPPPNGPAILIIHGKLDAVIPFSSVNMLLAIIPHAKSVQVGPRPGQIDSLDFGHNWYEYFAVERWRQVLESFFGDESGEEGRARL